MELKTETIYWVTLDQAAEALGVSRRTVDRYIKTGLLNASVMVKMDEVSRIGKIKAELKRGDVDTRTADVFSVKQTAELTGYAVSAIRYLIKTQRIKAERQNTSKGLVSRSPWVITREEVKRIIDTPEDDLFQRKADRRRG